MKMFGKQVKGPNVEYVVIPRGNGDNIVFKMQAVLDTKPFEQAVKPPVPGKKMLPGGVTQEDTDDPIYKDAVKHFGETRYAWIVLQSLKATEGLEWETVKEDNPSTWVNWETELRDAGFSRTEIQLVMLGVANANALNQDKIDEARSRFLLSLPAEPKGQ
jgi:hypothetical protein